MSKHDGSLANVTTVDVIGGARSDRLLLTSTDAARLRSTVRRHLLSAAARRRTGTGAGRLVHALTSAIVVPPERIPRDVITMRSRCTLKDLGSGEVRSLALVYPEEAAPELGRISVLSQLGSALLGLSSRAVIGERASRGRTLLFRIESVDYQPEEAKEFHL